MFTFYNTVSKMKIIVATPAFGGHVFAAYTSKLIELERLCVKCGIVLEILFVFNESLITRARNQLCSMFLKTDGTHLLFIDADIEFEPEDIMKLIQANKPLIGGLYPKTYKQFCKQKQKQG